MILFQLVANATFLFLFNMKHKNNKKSDLF